MAKRKAVAKKVLDRKNGVKPVKPRLVIDPPTEESPGFLYRMTQTTIAEGILNREDSTPEEKIKAFEHMVEIILPFVIEPSDPQEAKELMLGPQGLSEREFRELVGMTDDPLSEKQSETP